MNQVSPEAVKETLAKAAAGQATVYSADEAIRVAAGKRRTEIDRQLVDLRPATLTSEAAALSYSNLIEERGIIDQVLGMPSPSAISMS